MIDCDCIFEQLRIVFSYHHHQNAVQLPHVQ
jgi:hypothetical protein